MILISTYVLMGYINNMGQDTRKQDYVECEQQMRTTAFPSEQNRLCIRTECIYKMYKYKLLKV